MMTARAPLGLSSSGRKSRPNIGRTPSTENKLAEATAYWTFSGSTPPDKLSQPVVQALSPAQF
jgi:hypothetical protein